MLNVEILAYRNVRFTDEKTGEIIEGTSVHWRVVSDTENGEIPNKQFIKEWRRFTLGEQRLPIQFESSSGKMVVKLL